MTERPILFQAELVRSTIARRKRQTRRTSKLEVLNAAPSEYTFDRWQDGYPDGRPRAVFLDSESEPIGIPCPYGAVGDRLWVRETVLQAGQWGRKSPDDDSWSQWHGSDRILYGADEPKDHDVSLPEGWQWRTWPSIHMRRKWSRILLAVEAVRIERLTEISGADALAEGIEITRSTGDHEARALFRLLWNRVNGPRAWEANPWVWVVGFDLLEVRQ